MFRFKTEREVRRIRSVPGNNTVPLITSPKMQPTDHMSTGVTHTHTHTQVHETHTHTHITNILKKKKHLKTPLPVSITSLLMSQAIYSLSSFSITTSSKYCCIKRPPGLTVLWPAQADRYCISSFDRPLQEGADNISLVNNQVKKSIK